VARGGRSPLAVGLLVLCALAWGPTAAAQAPVVIDAEVSEAVSGGGTTRALVEVRVPVGADPEAIEAGESAVLARLVGTRFTLIRRYHSIPLLLLEIDDAALAALAAMPDAVTRVTANRPRSPSTSEAPR